MTHPLRPPCETKDGGRDGAASCSKGRRPFVLASAVLGWSMVFIDGSALSVAIPALREAGLLHSAWCIRHHRTKTFVLRLVRDLAERRKPPLTLVRRGWVLMRDEPRVVARHVELGARCATPTQAERELAGA